MEFIKNTKYEPGDLIRVKRKAGYFHYGILVSDNEVVNFAGEEKDSIMNHKDIEIRKTALTSFVKNDELEVLSPFSSMFTREEVVERALSYVGDKLFLGREYNLFNNNCEHFARYIYFNNKDSEQSNKAAEIVNDVIKTGAAITAGLVLTGITKQIQRKKQRNAVENKQISTNSKK